MRFHGLVLAILFPVCSCATMRDMTNRNISGPAAGGAQVATVPLKAFFDGTAPADQLSAKDLEQALTRKSGGTGNNYHEVQAWPMTPFLIRQRVTERETRNLSSATEIKDAVAKEERSYAGGGRTCFEVSIKGLDLQSTKTKYWVAKLRIGEKITALTFHDPDGTPAHLSPLSALDWRHWVQVDSACTAEKVDLSAGFELVLIPQIPDDAEPLTLKWARNLSWDG